MDLTIIISYILCKYRTIVREATNHYRTARCENNTH